MCSGIPKWSRRVCWSQVWSEYEKKGGKFHCMSFLTLCLTALGSFGTLFLAAKFIGHKQIAQLDFLIILPE